MSYAIQSHITTMPSSSLVRSEQNTIHRFFIKRLAIENFRNYHLKICDPITSNFICLLGNNGTGKTNMLEAISLIQQGKGLRYASYKDMLYKPMDYMAKNSSTILPWRIKVTLANTDIGDRDILITTDCAKKIISCDKMPLSIHEQKKLNHFFYATPRHDRILSENMGARRNFIDKLIALFEPSHRSNISKLDSALKERAKIIVMQGGPAWLDAVEDAIVNLSSIIANNRLFYQQQINDYLINNLDFLPKAHYEYRGFFESDMLDKSARSSELAYREYLYAHRDDEFLQKGVHKTDIMMIHQAKNMDAQFCSTGEQKLLMLSLILAGVRMYITHKKYYPILLLDDICAHLDQNRIKDLFFFLKKLTCQVWFTGTHEHFFASIHQDTQFFELS